jgi:predicted transcriptional regulator
MSGFRKLPSWWSRDEKGLKRFIGGANAGASIAALKCLLAITLMSEYSTQQARVSYGGLMDLTGLSRPMIPRAIKKLEAEGMIEICRKGYVNSYQLLSSKNDDRWAKVPYDKVRKALGGIPNKGDAALSALKIYIQLITMRWNSTRDVEISYDKLRDYIGIQKHRIRPGLDILFSHTLVHIKQVEDLEYKTSKQAHNVYTILGDLRMPN